LKVETEKWQPPKLLESTEIREYNLLFHSYA